jgi:tagatose 6-phosphate kinase
VILAVCLNPAVDVTYRLDAALESGGTNRVGAVHERAGGKGINVARVLRRLGASVTVLGPVGGVSGATIRSDLQGIRAALVDVAGATRRTIAVVGPAETTVLCEPGPVLGPGEWTAVVAAFERELAGASLVVLSGSLPPGVPADGYRTLAGLAAERHVRVILDASGEPLRLALDARPYLVKPNLDELRTVVGPLGNTGRDAAQIADGAYRLRELGARNVVVSRGDEGMLAVTEDGEWQVSGRTVVAGNPTGAGDALAAALARGTVRGDPWPRRLRDGAALAGAAVAAPLAGDIDEDALAGLDAGVRIERLNGVGF